MGLQIRRLGYALGAEVTGVDFAKPLDAATVEAIRRASHEHIVLCFPDQNLEGGELSAACAKFGELDKNLGSPNLHPVHPEIRLLTNKPILVEGKAAGGNGRADFWHSDNSYTVRPATLTFVLAKELPEAGGNTMFANQYMAYETLSPAYRGLLDEIESVDDVRFGAAYARSSPEQRVATTAVNPPVVHPVVRVHPETGRKALYIGNRVRRFVGMTEEETQPFRTFLMEHATRYEFTYRHQWKVNDLVVWDNRCALHYAVQDFDPSQLRRMLRCALSGPQTGRVYAERDESLATAVGA